MERSSCSELCGTDCRIGGSVVVCSIRISGSGGSCRRSEGVVEELGFLWQSQYDVEMLVSITSSAVISKMNET